MDEQAMIAQEQERRELEKLKARELERPAAAAAVTAPRTADLHRLVADRVLSVEELAEAHERLMEEQQTPNGLQSHYQLPTSFTSPPTSEEVRTRLADTERQQRGAAARKELSSNSSNASSNSSRSGSKRVDEVIVLDDQDEDAQPQALRCTPASAPASLTSSSASLPFYYISWLLPLLPSLQSPSLVLVKACVVSVVHSCPSPPAFSLVLLVDDGSSSAHFSMLPAVIEQSVWRCTAEQLSLMSEEDAAARQEQGERALLQMEGMMTVRVGQRGGKREEDDRPMIVGLRRPTLEDLHEMQRARQRRNQLLTRQQRGGGGTAAGAAEQRMSLSL